MKNDGQGGGRTGRADEPKEVSRREALGVLGLAALTTAFKWTPHDVAHAGKLVRTAVKSATPYAPSFFTPHEWETVRLLADLVIPKDERSGSATDAGVPEFMDFMMNDRPDGQIPMRGGLAWLDAECYDRFGKTFVASTDAERTAVLDDIAWPKKAKPELTQGAAFFSMFRDLTASGFWSSKIGIADLDYQGNTFVAEWKGCPDEALKKLGVQYES
ncbi:MAG TPA: gluconate 2-dehydrogenase subunit 3 family protein [Gemmatimonadales bacterium]|nr:gluconate 2-dehydrogenase subunit 3 family protein [Gemmatimonadales bacterium]